LTGNKVYQGLDEVAGGNEYASMIRPVCSCSIGGHTNKIYDEYSMTVTSIVPNSPEGLIRTYVGFVVKDND